MHHSESRRVWMEDDTEGDVDGDIPVEFDTDGQPAEAEAVSFDDVEREVGGIPSDLDPPRPKHAILPPPLPKSAKSAAEPEPEPTATLMPPSTRDLASVTTHETFSFPPPTIQSVAPVAADMLPESPVVPMRPKAGHIVLAAGSMAAIVVAMFASWSSLTAPNTAAWAENWKPPAPPAAAATPIPEPAQATYFSLDPVEVFTPSAQPAPPTTTTAARKAAVAIAGDNVRHANRSAMSTNARVALDDVLQAARTTCGQGAMNPITARVTATFGPEGRVIDVQVDVPASASDVGGCLAVAARRTRINSFEGDPLQISRTIKLH